MTTDQRICSGLGEKVCTRRDQCQRYVHWTIDRRSEFNLCSQSKRDLFIGAHQAKQQAAMEPQMEMFS